MLSFRRRGAGEYEAGGGGIRRVKYRGKVVIMLNIDLENGEMRLPSGETITSSITLDSFDDTFKKTEVTKGEPYKLPNGRIWQQFWTGPLTDFGKQFKITFHFLNNVLGFFEIMFIKSIGQYGLFGIEDTKYHENVLKNMYGEPPYEYPWGKIESYPESHMYRSCIRVTYKHDGK
ncbi:MAG: hypothetical protein FWE86_05250, partial [Oscillospiraceae bacterium]|nr:hypothetical protein [Oscillospiraceae bacterium]